MTLKIISAEDVVFEGEVTSVTLPGAMGEFTVLRNHASLVSVLNPGNITYVSGGESVTTPVGGGIVDVDNNVVSVCIY
jgi:F-type H+-transporting ATPase subunit epsilon